MIFFSVLECIPNMLLHNGTCLSKCPHKFYDSRNDLNQNAEETNFPNSAKCLECHYSCKTCTGSMDYQCTQCFPDALLYNASSIESYCYPSRILTEVISEKWYYRVILVVIAWCLLSLILGFVYYKKKPKGYRRLETEEEGIKIAAFN